MSNPNPKLSFLALAAATFGIVACAPPGVPGGAGTETNAARPAHDAVRDAALRAPPAILVPAARRSAQVLVHKSPTCGCCMAWVEHLRDEGFNVEVRDVDDLEPVKSRLGVPYGKGSCHTAEVDGYFIEGHVPASDIKRLLAERPASRGLTLPGMPIGSPGMESPDDRVQPYTVELVARDGSTSEYAYHGGGERQE